MIPINTYRIRIENYHNIVANWVIEATEEEIEEVVKRINKGFDFVNVSYKIVDEEDEVEVTHVLLNNEIWTKVNI